MMCRMVGGDFETLHIEKEMLQSLADGLFRKANANRKSCIFDFSGADEVSLKEHLRPFRNSVSHSLFEIHPSIAGDITGDEEPITQPGFGSGEIEQIRMMHDFGVIQYNFDWQMPYKLEQNKIKLPKGSTVWAEAVFDNSAYNTHNPNPARDVPAGFQTYNEMLQGFFFYVDANENLKLEVDPKTGLALKK